MSIYMRAKRIFIFDAAHSLPGYHGKCSSMHGHTYKLEVLISRADNGVISGGSSDGMVFDFRDLNQIVKDEIMDKVDHKVLNEVFPFRTTSENLAQHIFDVLTDKVGQHGIVVEQVALWETQNSCIEVGIRK